MLFTMNLTKEVLDLRARTGNGLRECRRSLEKTHGNVDKATIILREMGQTVTKMI